MATMGNYCKAYLLKQLRAFPGWQEQSANTRPDPQLDEQSASNQTRSLIDEDIVYLQENYVVTDGVFKDEYILFDTVTDEWQTFCQQQLNFQIPDYARTPNP